MSKTKDLLQLLEELGECGVKLTETAAALKEHFSSEKTVTSVTEEKPAKAQPPKTEAKEEAAPSYTKEKVRELLSEVAAKEEGKYKAQVKDLVKKYADGGSLKDIPEDKYSDLVAELEVIGNG